jgi:hypothetical protein
MGCYNPFSNSNKRKASEDLERKKSNIRVALPMVLYNYEMKRVAQPSHLVPVYDQNVNQFYQRPDSLRPQIADHPDPELPVAVLEITAGDIQSANFPTTAGLC